MTDVESACVHLHRHLLPHRVLYEKPDAGVPSRAPAGPFRYIWGIIKNRDGHLFRINGLEDHLHILTSLHPTVNLADFVKDIKTGSTLWIKENSVFQRFSHWQEGYAAFTCCKRDMDGLIEYIKRQEEHHRKTTFDEEYRKLLVDAGIQFDERYMP